MIRSMSIAPFLIIFFGLAACEDDGDNGTFPPIEPMDVSVDQDPQPDLGSDMGPSPDMDTDAGPTCEFSEDPIPDAEIYTPRWAFLPWISKDISDRDDTYEFVKGFLDREIPLGVVVLDSPWETNYNTFIPNPNRYPDFDQMVSDLRADGVRTVLWVTAQVNRSSYDLETGGDRYEGAASNYEEGVACGFFVNNGRLDQWWKGRGASVDFFNPNAVAWWHQQQDALYDAGIAGWKLDFGESYIIGDTIQTHQGVVPHQDYSEAYYRDFFNYGASRVGTDEFVTMVRGYDKSYQFEGRFFARREHAPVIWMGDNHRDWEGLEDALDHTFRSAAAGYAVVGSDLGGYLDRDEKNLAQIIPFDRTNFHRWLAVSGLSPFMQLHGRANIAPWSLPDDPNPEESVANYKFWSVVHTELIPFWYSLSRTAYATEGEENIVRPIGDGPEDWAGDYRYMIGDALLVAPILDETGIRDVELPSGTYFDWWTGQEIAGNQTVNADFATDLQKIPVYVKEGAIIPMDIISDLSGIGTDELVGALTILAWHSAAGSSFDLYEEDKSLTTIEFAQSFEISRTLRPTYLRLRLGAVPTGFTLTQSSGSAPLVERTLEELHSSESGWTAEGDYFWVKLPTSNEALSVEILD